MLLPVLESMTSGYFHQDYDLSSPGNEPILLSFVCHREVEQVRQTVFEIDQLLATPLEGLLDRLEKSTRYGNLTIRETDREARQWREMARATLDRTISAP